ncbi:VOC family protein [Bradyrhizobium sp.]|uniref:VOC family protein n=1 Tax=Bradyrhizobium sp. TaxID=376 RepID=UPI00262F70C6|nr:VOC family protein [Bradyrhizobium sp.]
MFLRLRQLCLVAHDLEPVVEDLMAVFDIEVCHRDPAVAKYGLRNALLPIGNSFVEIVAPTKDKTAAGRYLDRRKGNGGYMVILDTDELDRWQKHVDAIDVRIATRLASDGYRGLQLHPRDTGGTLLEINWSDGGAGVNAAYHPAGPGWHAYVRTTVVKAIIGAELQSDHPERLAAKWSVILRKPARPIDGQWRIDVDNAGLRFVPARDGRGEGLSGIDLRVTERARVRDMARRRGLAVTDGAVLIGGVRFNLTETKG